MRVLLTRPKEDAEVFAERLRERGHAAVSAPLLTVRFHDGPALALGGVQAILATSANGVRALARRTDRRDLPVFAVGPQTAQEARKAGFARVECANGDVAALSKAVPRWAHTDTGALLHATDAEGARRLAVLLTAKGYAVNAMVLYDVAAATALPQDVVRALREGSLDAAVFFSPRGARIFRECILSADLARACAGLVAVCISQAVAEALSPLSFKEIRVAGRPNQDALLACFG
ncbi:MAG: uroporphyrinogen-III synthase [Alphaproteobacteria bacterium]|nr:uroporphyrinogen-III synthase [Alphaproteobacteria bacterium]MDE2109537.1 uroporphyrinogen-III synthase [Alphaproteobacteria bacterium]MDE2493708.1 uroporphyrinogen-III synthase [Alphaproteobacteria bacterium]